MFLSNESKHIKREWDIYLNFPDGSTADLLKYVLPNRIGTATKITACSTVAVFGVSGSTNG